MRDSQNIVRMDKPAIIEALARFINQRPGLELANYGSLREWRAEARAIAKDLNQARTLLAAVDRASGITAADIVLAAERAFSGRLSIVSEGDGARIDYCTGQYWPTEYRRAVCAVLAAALWNYWRASLPADTDTAGRLRRTTLAEFGRSIAARWFN